MHSRAPIFPPSCRPSTFYLESQRALSHCPSSFGCFPDSSSAFYRNGEIRIPIKQLLSTDTAHST
jgi:hypothetical protein